MPVTLRSPNDPVTPDILLAAVAAVLIGAPTPNTALGNVDAAGGGANVVYIRDKYSLRQGPLPAVNLRLGPHRRQRTSRSTWSGETTVILEYFSGWSQSASEQSAILIAMDEDLERIAANLESNETLTIGNTDHTLNLFDLTKSPDEPYWDRGMDPPLPYRVLTLRFTLLEWDV